MSEELKTEKGEAAADRRERLAAYAHEAWAEIGRAHV